MIKISRTGVGTVATAGIRDSQGTALLPIQAHGDGATTFRVLGRVSPDAPFVEIVAPGTSDFLESISWVPELELEVTAGAGSVTLWIGSK